MGISRESHKDGTKLCGIPVGMYLVALFDFYGAPAATKVVFKLLNRVANHPVFLGTSRILASLSRVPA